ncbi:hypothetical protein B0T26DRAFT_676952 [Lasiosphaeria miniovina]|uniref:Uncharacterized protein n=1 Tax=Lasiosphaeria miniovina TaxID=1954250 RepID=A0AA40AAW1_9PEZI|nr:uncharacterized protein B0T26DRAFT_676952 [Lasiosphaeria miniovina]KAK0712501.1 hypothetical protein B0T26DRAFT_676952 [Lasiosphaeria miniovina]
MTKLAIIVLATAAALVKSTAAYGFKSPCPVDKDICGWALQSNYGYDNEILADATGAANQNVGSGTVIYDSIYNCYPDGEIVWSVWCGGGGSCDKAASPNSQALCKGEPVDTGRAPPVFPPDDPIPDDPLPVSSARPVSTPASRRWVA